MNKQTKIILIYSVIACTLLYITENVFHPTYLIQMLQKVLSFIVIPVLLGKYMGFSFGKFGSFTKESIKFGLAFGLLGAVVIGITYFFLTDIIDWPAISESLTKRGINKTTFLFVFIYIMFGNSFVEEYFFRGIIFNSLKEKYLLIGYILSSLIFALYHITIFGTRFHGYILLLALFGLFVGGLFFAWLYTKTKGIWSAWIFHIIADLVILVIGYTHFFS